MSYRLIYLLLLLSICLSFHSMDLESAEKHALVAGGAGFLGSHLCERLLQEGYEVTCVDNLQTGSIENISSFRKKECFHFIEQDICTLEISDQVFDEVYNLACPASPRHYQATPLHTLDTGYIGTSNLLRIAKRCNARFLQASTSEVYGNPLMHPQKEHYWGNVNPIGIRACYDEGKRIAETLCFEYHRLHDVSIKVVRIFNTYGPNMNENDGRVVSNFITQALRGVDITVYGDGSQTRSYCYVDDLINGFRKFMNTPKEFTGPMNLGNPTELSVLELAELIVTVTDSPSKIVFKELPKDDPVKRKPDISLAMKKCEWEPKVSLVEGIQRTAAYFQGCINN